MRTPPSTANGLDGGPLHERAWRLLLAASAEGRPRSAEPEAAWAAGPSAVRAVQAWLTRSGRAVTTSTVAPAAVHPWLDLYGPLCTAAPGWPLTIAHLGQSLDGQIATASGDSYYVTGPDNVRHLHRLRALAAAVIVGAGTVARDDPKLTVRHVEGASPVRVILDPRARLRADHRVFTDGAAPTLVVHAAGLRARPPGHAEVLSVPAEGERLRLDALLERLHERGLWSVFVEGGGATVSSFLQAGVLDRLHVAIAPLVTGSGRPGLALPARDKIADCLRPAHRVFAMGGDVLFDCDLRAAPTAASAEAADELRRVF
jgi:diaminohydroxyphosphoribosylaminopyrimidine deaminase/5-amino-6-(5-phosphoribosylamino)uracil reductase